MAFVLILAPVLESCEKETPDTPPTNPLGELEKLSTVSLDITEPSGLSFGPDNATLLIVSDNTNKVYETNLQGDIIRELAFVGSDLEGVAYNPDENIIAVTEERKREVVLIDYNTGIEQSRHEINVDQSVENAGLEGISYNKSNLAYYIVNEQLPGELIIWNTQFDIIDKSEIRFADDYSGIFVDTQNALLWFISDESRAMYKADYNGNVIKEYPLLISKFEGITIDVGNNLLYLVNDATFELTTYKIIE